MRIAVVGAGFAGLAAADALQRAGHEVMVLEARTRVGGRVHSVPFADSVVERGAEFVFSGHDTVRQYCARFGLTLYRKGVPYGNREPRGGVPTSRAAISAAASGLGIAEAARSLAEAIALCPGDRAAHAAIRARLEMTHAWPADDLEAGVLADCDSTFGDYDTFTIAGGNQQLAQCLASGLATLHHATVVRRVRWQAGSVELATDRGPVSAARALFAIPTTALTDIAFEPALPEALAAALARMRYGQAVKLFLRLLAPAPADAVMSVPERLWTFTSLGPNGAAPTVCGAFAGTPAAVQRLTADPPHRCIEAVRRLRPELALDLNPETALLATWHDDPYVRGVYAAATLARHAGDEVLIAAPVGPLSFAGEHTAGEYSGYMEGALRSGLRAAREIVAAP